MAELVEVVKPTEAEYVVKLTQAELDFMVGVMSDLADNPQRKVYMSYGIDESLVEPSAKGLAAAKSLSHTLSGYEVETYDYYDYWDDVSE